MRFLNGGLSLEAVEAMPLDYVSELMGAANVVAQREREEARRNGV